MDDKTARMVKKNISLLCFTHVSIDIYLGFVLFQTFFCQIIESQNFVKSYPVPVVELIPTRTELNVWEGEVRVYRARPNILVPVQHSSKQ